jgi:hypothetical protein
MNLNTANDLNLDAKHRNNFYYHLKRMNADIGYNFTHCNTFTTDFEHEFLLSALPSHSKAFLLENCSSLIEQQANGSIKDVSEFLNYDLDISTFKAAPLTKKRSLNESNSSLNASQSESVKSSKTFRNQSQLLQFKKQNLSSFKVKSNKKLNSFNGEAGPESMFNIDDFFDKFHKIATNQNFRLSSLAAPTESSSASNLKSMEQSSSSEELQVPQRIPSNRLSVSSITSTLTSSTRLNHKLNSYKLDKLHPSDEPVRNEKLSLDASIDFYGIKQPTDKECLVLDLNADSEISEIWKNGFALTSKKEFCIKSACFICASIGVENEFLFCNVCCEPFHEFCLDEYEKPKVGTDLLDWVCPTCKFCEVCKLQDKLLNCQKCESCYHSGCFRDHNYPKKPSKRNQVWVCFDCFECDKCGGRKMHYDKKTFAKLPDYDFTICFGCINNSSTAKQIQDTSREYKCCVCANVIDCTSEDLTAEQVDVVGALGSKLECPACSMNKQQTLKEQLDKLKLRFILDLFARLNKEFLNDEEFERFVSDKDAAAAASNVVDFFGLTSDLYTNLLAKTKDTGLEQTIKDRLVENAASQENGAVLHSILAKLNIVPKKEERKSEHPIKKKVETNRKKNPPQLIVKCPHEDHTYALTSTTTASLEQQEAKDRCLDEQFDVCGRVEEKLNKDLNWNEIRECITCRIVGDHNICGRLLPLETNWIHVNCLLWSNDALTQGHLIKQVQNVLNKIKSSVSIRFLLF